MKICVLGLGYMGLPTASLFATHNYEVVGVDIDEQKVASLNQGKCPFEEPGLDELFKKAHEGGHFKATTQIESADVFIIAVPTPLTEKKAELKYVKSATEMISGVLKEGNLVVLESTVSPRTCVDVIKPILDKVTPNYLLSHCPERAIPGNTMYEIVHNDRIIGGFDEESTKFTVKLYESFVKGEIFTTDITTAETCKLMENTFRDANIALANEFAKICDELGIDVWEATYLANRHPRVNILQPGPGVGGHCLAVDPWFLTEKSSTAKLIPAARAINDSMPAYTVEQLQKKLNPPAIIGVLGVAYKKNVDDARETPAQGIIQSLKEKGYEVMATDPYINDFTEELFPLNEVLEKSTGIILVTDHDDYKEIDFEKFTNIKTIMDTRNTLQNLKSDDRYFTL